MFVSCPRPDIPLEDSQSVSKLRESLLGSLQECISSLRTYNCSQHLGQMLLCLPLLRQTDAAIRRYWSSIRKDGKVRVNVVLSVFFAGQPKTKTATRAHYLVTRFRSRRRCAFLITIIVFSSLFA